VLEKSVAVAIDPDYRAVDQEVASLCHQLDTQGGIFVIGIMLPHARIVCEDGNPILCWSILLGLEITWRWCPKTVFVVWGQPFIRLRED